jgi:two-component SAPR family response regulator
MTVSQILGISLEDFKTATNHKKVVLLYPWSSYRNVFLAHFLSARDSGLLYFRLTGQDQALHTWLADLADNLDEIQDGLSQNLRSAITAGQPGPMGEALAADLARYANGQGLVLFLDEMDRATLDAGLQTFAEALVAALAPDIQLVINSRYLKLNPWHALVARGEACVLGTEKRANNVMFTVEDQLRPQLEVYAFGRGHVLVNGQEIVQWDGALPRKLFFYLMDYPLATRDDIFDIFWPELSVKEATNVFHVTKRKIGERISAQVDDKQNYELTQYKAGFYLPSDKVARYYDVYEFRTAVEQSMLAASDEQEAAHLLRAIDLYRQPFLTTIDMDWTNQRREELEQLYVQALISMARLHKRNGDWQPALGYFVRVIGIVPEREDVHREIMKLYVQQEMYDDACRQYRMLEKAINDSLQIQPSHETQALFEALQAR